MHNRNNEDPTLHEKRHVMHVGPEHVEDGVSDGLKETKLKPKLTRLARMTDGRESLRISEPTMILGKHGMQQ